MFHYITKHFMLLKLFCTPFTKSFVNQVLLYLHIMSLWFYLWTNIKFYKIVIASNWCSFTHMSTYLLCAPNFIICIPHLLLSFIVHMLSLFYTPTPSSIVHATYHCFFVHQLHNIFDNFKKMLINTNLELSQKKFVDQGESLHKFNARSSE